MHQIGEVAEAVGLSLRTIRYYDEVGIVVPSGRSAGGFRLYTDADIERLRFVKDLKPLEFTLEEIRTLLETIDEVADATADGAHAADRLAAFAELGQQRCIELRAQLQAAERVVDAIQTHTRTHAPRG
jgi:DNA-binding transcriptional MerR regulator